MGRYIDVHHHILPPGYVDAVGAVKIGAQGSSGRLPYWKVEDALERMDAADVACAITSVSAPGLDVPDGDAAGLARACNEVALDMCAAHPRRFGCFATVPLVSADAALAEVRFAYEQGQADGVCLLSNFRGAYLGDENLWPLYEELDRRSAVVFVHPTSPAVPVAVAGLSLSSLDFTFDTARTIASLIFSGVLHRFPRIRFIFSHMGGAMPYIADRIEVLARNDERLQAHIPNGMRAELARCYFDTALSANEVTFSAMRAISGVDNLLFGTDYPFGPKDQVASAAAALRDRCGDACQPLDAKGLWQIARGNAEQLFPRWREKA
ncbi:MAG: amidohydrolase family protein [Pigmentiphaga sp.]